MSSQSVRASSPYFNAPLATWRERRLLVSGAHARAHPCDAAARDLGACGLGCIPGPLRPDIETVRQRALEIPADHVPWLVASGGRVNATRVAPQRCTVTDFSWFLVRVIAQPRCLEHSSVRPDLLRFARYSPRAATVVRLLGDSQHAHRRPLSRHCPMAARSPQEK